MSECPHCRAKISEDLPFCGQCGARVSGKIAAEAAAAAAQSDQTGESPKPVPVTRLADDSLRALAEAPVAGAPAASDKPKRTTGERQPTIKQLDPGTVLNTRYEIVRRIGGGGMGAVYLAKDRNLGDAPRAVKEMVEAHIDESQHEKAIGDFKRESLLLTSLEHPSIPTIYDYFYDSQWNRFYLVMKYISGGDLASRLRSSTGGRLDAYTDTGWGREVADALASEHWRA